MRICVTSAVCNTYTFNLGVTPQTPIYYKGIKPLRLIFRALKLIIELHFLAV